MAAGGTPTVEKVVVVRRTGQDVALQQGRDITWDELVAGQPATCSPTWVEATHPLYVLYTSGKAYNQYFDYNQIGMIVFDSSTALNQRLGKMLDANGYLVPIS